MWNWVFQLSEFQGEVLSFCKIKKLNYNSTKYPNSLLNREIWLKLGKNSKNGGKVVSV